jgi:hypothetical protein
MLTGSIVLYASYTNNMGWNFILKIYMRTIPQCMWDKWGRPGNQRLIIHMDKSTTDECLSSRGHNF